MTNKVFFFHQNSVKVSKDFARIVSNWLCEMAIANREHNNF